MYADIYEVVYNYNGNYFDSIFAGPNLIQNPSTGAISGTVTGYLESIWNGSTWQTYFGVENINISAAALWNASLTASNTDDLAILRQALSGADNFYMSSQADKVNGFDGNPRPAAPRRRGWQGHPRHHPQDGRRRLGLTSSCHSMAARVGGSTTIPQLVQLAIATWVGEWVKAAVNDFYQLNQWSEVAHDRSFGK